MSRLSKDEYKLADGSSVFVGGMDEVPEGATLWRGYDYKNQYWVINGERDTRTLEDMIKENEAKHGISYI